MRPGSLTARLDAERPDVLVVEDEADIAEFLRAFFQASGLPLRHLDPDGPEQVVAAIAERRPGCVLLDLHLRGFSGLDAYRLLRSDPANALLPVIVLTADARESMRRTALGRGVDAFVTKPFNVRTLFAMVEERIRQSEARAAESDHPTSGDTVTGVATHSYLQDRLVDELGMAGATGTPVALGLVRVRSLPETTRKFGAPAGNRVLHAVAQRLLATVPGDVLVGRNGADEFGIVLPGFDAARAVELVAQAVEAGEAPVDVDDELDVPVMLAAGIAVYPDHASDPDGLYMAADAALVAACEDAGPVNLAL